MSLGRKQRITNEAWLEAVATVESTVSEAALGELVAATIEDIKAKTAGKKAAYAWSGGKDSIVLGKLCEAAGVVDSMIGVCDLEYPAFAAWIEANKPESCEVINTHQGLDWLARHPEMKAIVKRLLADGKSVQEIGKQLGMRPEEVFRLSDFSRDDFLSMMTKGVHGYSKAELLTKY